MGNDFGRGLLALLSGGLHGYTEGSYRRKQREDELARQAAEDEYRKQTLARLIAGDERERQQDALGLEKYKLGLQMGPDDTATPWTNQMGPFENQYHGGEGSQLGSLIINKGTPPWQAQREYDVAHGLDVTREQEHLWDMEEANRRASAAGDAGSTMNDATVDAKVAAGELRLGPGKTNLQTVFKSDRTPYHYVADPTPEEIVVETLKSGRKALGSMYGTLGLLPHPEDETRLAFLEGMKTHGIPVPIISELSAATSGAAAMDVAERWEAQLGDALTDDMKRRILVYIATIYGFSDSQEPRSAVPDSAGLGIGPMLGLQNQ